MVWSGFDPVMVDTRRNTFVQRANLRPFTVCKKIRASNTCSVFKANYMYFVAEFT